MKPTGIDELLEKATAAFAKRQHIEEKIRLAQFHFYMKTPLDILEGSADQD